MEAVSTLQKASHKQELGSNADLVAHSSKHTKPKFGTIVGVFIPCLLMLFGVVIFLRLGWVVGVVGLPTTAFIITMSTAVALMSTLSMAAIATNIQVGNGGVYYIISRSLGLEIGSAVGIPIYLKETLSLAFYIVGFAESLHDLFPALSIQHIGLVTLSVLSALAAASTKGALKIQMITLGVVTLSFASLFSGGDLRPMHSETFTPEATGRLGFWAMFAIFFPAMTGVESVVSLSGDLKSPSRSLPRGAISATVVAFLTYLAVAIFLAYHVPLERLASDPLIIQDVARIPSLVVLGIWGATLSSALGGILSAPRTLQAMSNDGVVPRFLGKSFTRSGGPHIAMLLSFALSFTTIYYGSINLIAPMMTMICLVCYGVLNFSAGIETLIANPSWRPTFPVHWGLSLGGAGLCLLCMLMIDAGTAIICLSTVVVIYVLVRRYKVQKSWEDIREGILRYLSRSAVYRLSLGNLSSSKSWRPHFLVFSKATKEQSEHLLKVFQSISQSKGFITVASFISESNVSREKQHKLAEIMANRFREQDIHCFVNIRESQNTMVDIQQMIKYYGLGPIRPNTVVLGMLKDGNEADKFVDVIQTAYSNRCNVVLMSHPKMGRQGDIESTAKQEKVKEIHIWWDDKNEDNSELMLIFSYMLLKQSNKVNNVIRIKAIIPDERAKNAKKEQFKALSERLRIPLHFDIYVSQKSTDEEYFSFLRLFSENASIIFLSLRPPSSSSAEHSDYSSYLRMLSKNTAQLQDVVMVLSSELTPLEKILQ